MTWCFRSGLIPHEGVDRKSCAPAGDFGRLHRHFAHLECEIHHLDSLSRDSNQLSSQSQSFHHSTLSVTI